MTSLLIPAGEVFQELRKRYWGKHLSEVVFMHAVSRGEDPIELPNAPESCEVFVPDPYFDLELGEYALVRDEYKMAEELLTDEGEDVVIFTGSAGIGS